MYWLVCNIQLNTGGQMKIKQQGFAILITAIVLSIAGVAYTASMAYLQIIDNQVLGNYYRNSEAFVNAESGINLTLSKLKNVSTATNMLDNLPYIYTASLNATTSYQVTVTQLSSNKLHIISVGHSQDGTASKQVSVQVYYDIAFNIPTAPLSSNGKLQINAADSINDGCEGLTVAECRSPGSIAPQITLSQPSFTLPSTVLAQENNDQPVPDFCLDDSLQGDNIDLSAIYGSLFDQDGLSRFKQINLNQWGSAASASGSVFDQVQPIEDMNSATSLFENTFGITWQDAKGELTSSSQVAHIDMGNLNNGSCSEQLQNVDDLIDIIYITGDCDIKQQHTSTNSAGNKHFTIGSADDPKLIFMEGGSFTALPNTHSAVIGLLYLLPDSEEVIDENGNLVYIDGIKQTAQDMSIDLAGIQVNGALLSEYSCSVSSAVSDNFNSDNFNNNFNNNNSLPPLSIRYDKNVLNQLYKQLGMTDATSNYQLVAGTWRDF